MFGADAQERDVNCGGGSVSEVDELGLLREAISLAECNSCEGNLGDNNWVVVDYTERYYRKARQVGIWETERKALLCAWCAASNNNGSAPHLGSYRNHRGPGLRLLGPDMKIIEDPDG